MRSRLIDKIDALLAKAESTDSLYERDALISKAQELANANAIPLEIPGQNKGDGFESKKSVSKDFGLFAHFDKPETEELFTANAISPKMSSQNKSDRFEGKKSVSKDSILAAYFGKPEARGQFVWLL